MTDPYTKTKEYFNSLELMKPQAIEGLIDPDKKEEFKSFAVRFNNEPENLESFTVIEFENNNYERFRKMQL